MAATVPLPPPPFELPFELLPLLTFFFSEGVLPATPADDSPEVPRRGAGAAVLPPFALFSNAAARVDAFGPLEAPITAAALPVAGLLADDGGAAAAAAAILRLYEDCFTKDGLPGDVGDFLKDVCFSGDEEEVFPLLGTPCFIIDGFTYAGASLPAPAAELMAAEAAAVFPAGDPFGAELAVTGKPPARGRTPPGRGFAQDGFPESAEAAGGGDAVVEGTGVASAPAAVAASAFGGGGEEEDDEDEKDEFFRRVARRCGDEGGLSRRGTAAPFTD